MWSSRRRLAGGGGVITNNKKCGLHLLCISQVTSRLVLKWCHTDIKAGNVIQTGKWIWPSRLIEQKDIVLDVVSDYVAALTVINRLLVPMLY